MAQNKFPRKPKENRQWEDIGQRISSIGQQISAPVGDLSNRVSRLTNEIKSNNEETERDEKEYRKNSLWWTRWNTGIAGAALFFSVVFASTSLYVLWYQVFVQQTDQRAWIELLSKNR